MLRATCGKGKLAINGGRSGQGLADGRKCLAKIYLHWPHNNRRINVWMPSGRKCALNVSDRALRYELSVLKIHDDIRFVIYGIEHLIGFLSSIMKVCPVPVFPVDVP